MSMRLYQPTSLRRSDGLFLPDLQAAIFPKETRNVLYTGAQLGVGLYMFLVGTTLQLNHFKSKARSAVGVSLAGIAAPFFIAFLITPFLVTVPGLFAPGISQVDATLFMGACIALTAFPMLARIINERGLANTALGTLSLTAGAFDDACSWCVLAIVLATFGAGPDVAILAIGGAVLYAAFMMLFGRRLLAPLGRIVEREGEMSLTALGIGALMNSRGLMELIIINIGLQKGIIGPALFSMLVLMAIVTTMMASPLFEFVYGRKARASGELGAIGSDDAAAAGAA
jgi:Kef-type K+ transport system membrane component KefB